MAMLWKVTAVDLKTAEQGTVGEPFAVLPTSANGLILCKTLVEINNEKSSEVGGSLAPDW